MTACSSPRQLFSLSHDLFGKWLHTFPVFGVFPTKMRARKDAVHGNIWDAKMFKTKGSG
jgi:hypothetical protein